MSDVEDLTPFERELYVQMLNNWVKEQEESQSKE